MRCIFILMMLVWSTLASAEVKLVAVLEFRGVDMDPQMKMQLSEAARGGGAFGIAQL